MIFLRFILVAVAVFLIIRALTNHGETEAKTVRKPEQDSNKASNKKVSKKIGDYIDYEEVKKENR